MFDWLFGRSKCAICKGKPKSPSKYYDDKGNPIVVCFQCVPYAERRAFRKR